MPAEPEIKRAVSFIDGQNLYRYAKDAFGHHHPSYDPRTLADAVCAERGWVNQGVRFYTGVPSAERMAGASSDKCQTGLGCARRRKNQGGTFR